METDKTMKTIIRTSKFLSLVLRHKPEVIHLNMDSNGWVDINELINNANQYKNMQLTKETLMEVVKKNDKQRFIVDSEKNKIRANQGHSVSIDWKAGVHTPRLASVKFTTTEKVVKPIFGSGYGPRQYYKFPIQRRYLGACPEVLHLALEPQTPPDELYHGTAAGFLESIMKNGIKPMSRQYVHLSRTAEIAETVGKRHGKPVVLKINAKAMYEKGHTFYLSENKIWLVDYIPKEYIKEDIMWFSKTS